MAGPACPAEIRVVKLGGSLLQFPGLVPALRSWIDLQPPQPTLLLAGGGGLADWVREADGRFHLGEASAHWIAVGTLSVTARLQSCLLPEARLAESWDELSERLRTASRERLWVVDPAPFLRGAEPSVPGRRLAATWDVTSDSIAARLAVACRASELVLLKSCEPPARDFARAAKQGFVDADFPLAAAELPRVRWVNLRSGREGVLAVTTSEEAS